MKTISIKGIAIKNFRSFTDDFVDFPITPGLRFITGDNKVDERLGANGAGKSSLFDALTWCLYGTSLKGAKTSSVVSWGQKDVGVIVELAISGVSYVIKRVGPPMKVEINDVPAEQAELDLLLGLTKECFVQAVIFGQGRPLFPDLPVPERGLLFDEVLNLNLWTRCTESASLKHKTLEKEINDNKSQVAYVQGCQSNLKSDDDYTALIQSWESGKAFEIDQLIKQKVSWDLKQQLDIETHAQASKDHKEKFTNLLASSTIDAKTIEAKLLELKTFDEGLLGKLSADSLQYNLELGKVNSSIHNGNTKLYTHKSTLSTILTQEAFWINNSTCSACTQSISDETKQGQMLELSKQKATIEVLISNSAKAVDDLVKEHTRLTELLNKNKIDYANAAAESRAYNKEFNRLTSELSSITTRIADYNKELNGSNVYDSAAKLRKLEINPYLELIEKTQNTVNPYIAEQQSTQKTRRECIDKLTAFNKTIEALESKKVAVEYWKSGGFKRIRLFFVQKILLALQVEIASAISSLGLDGWGVKLSTETQNKDGGIKFGIQLSVKSPTAEGAWEAWSGGEAQRLRLAVGMGLASLIQRAAGVWYDFEVWDEPTASLSDFGIEDLLEALKYRSESQDKQIFFVDHSALTYTGFSEIWKICKDIKGSVVYKQQG